MRLGGWARSGIVVSFLFVAGLHGWIAYDYIQEKERVIAWVRSLPADPEWLVREVPERLIPPFGWYRSPYVECQVIRPEAKCQIKVPVYLVVLLVPLGFLWVVIPSFICTVKWIRTGFR